MPTRADQSRRNNMTEGLLVYGAANSRPLKWRLIRGGTNGKGGRRE
ncbi:MAG: hypothetical protein AAGJ93_03895 [Bacteroidota bacterium]